MKKSLSSLSSLSVQTIGGIGSPMNRNFSGSMSLVTIKRTSGKIFNILIDCGMSKNSDGLFYNSSIKPKDIDLILLTHAHIDHIGLVPYFADNNNGFTGKIIATNETLKLSQIMLTDSANLNKQVNGEIQPKTQGSLLINESLSSYLKKEKAVLASMLTMSTLSKSQRTILNREKQQIIEYLPSIAFDKSSYMNSIPNINSICNNINGIFQGRNVYSLDYFEEFEVADGVRVSLANSAHILGSSQFLIKVEDGNGGNVNLGFSGDVGRYYDNNLGCPQVFDEKLDFYMIESTYGSRFHNNQFDQLISFIEEVANLGGKIFMPVFMLQRFQEVALKIIMMQKKLKYDTNNYPRFSCLPIYIDLPQAKLINTVFANSIYNETYKELLDNDKLVYLNGDSANKTVNSNCRGGIVFASGGMLQGGGIKKYMKYLKKQHNGLVFSGYQGEMTTGRQILDGTAFDKNKIGGFSSYGCRVFNGGFFQVIEIKMI